MAHGERFRGSSDIPLAPEGLRAADAIAQKIARKGGVDRIYTSDLTRTRQTAGLLSKYTHAPIVYSGDGLHPWHLGALEGQPVNDDNVDLVNHLVKSNPDLPIPGRGEASTRDGESFNQFKDRTLTLLRQVMAESGAHPNERTAVVTHYRVRKLLEAWLRKGALDSGEIDPDVMNDNTSIAPGSIERMQVTRDGPQMSNVDLDSPAHLGGGIYFVRHEKTGWNSSQS